MIIQVDPVYWPPFEAWDPGDGQPVRRLDELSEDELEEICVEILGAIDAESFLSGWDLAEADPADVIRNCQSSVSSLGVVL